MLAQRIVTGAVLGVVAIGTILWLPAPTLGVVLGVFWLLGVREWAAFARLAPAPTIGYLLGAGVAMLLGSLLVDARLIIVLVLGVAAAWWLVALGALLRRPAAISAPLTAVAGLAVLLPAWVLLAFLYSRGGPVWVLTLLGIVWSADVGAYTFGRWLGRHKLAPAISPGKTWEGVVGGLLCAGVGAGLAAAGLGVAALPLVLLGVVTAAASVVGDLTVSLFKRNAGLKDSGRLLPGHGGVLDRVDSLTAASAVFVLGLQLTGMITRW